MYFKQHILHTAKTLQKKLKIQKDFDSISFLLTPEHTIYLLGFLSSSKNTCSSNRTCRSLSLEREFLICSIGKLQGGADRETTYSSRQNCLRKEEAKCLCNRDHWSTPCLSARCSPRVHPSCPRETLDWEQLPYHGLEHSYISDLQGVPLFSQHGVPGGLSERP